MTCRLCVFCKHLDSDQGGYGEYADPAAMECSKGRWREVIGYGLDDFREKILVAEQCPDYELPKETKEFLKSKGASE